MQAGQGAPPPGAIVVQVVENPVESTTVGDILIGSLGLTGALLFAALILGLLLGGLLIAFKQLRARYGVESPPDGEAMRVTPNSRTL